MRAMEHFGGFLGLVPWAGKEFEAIQVKAPTQEEDGSWWKRTSMGPLPRMCFILESTFHGPGPDPGRVTDGEACGQTLPGNGQG